MSANLNIIAGRINFEYGLPARGITVRAYNRGFGGSGTKLAETKADDNGVYTLSYMPPPSGANVEIRVVDAQGRETTISAIKFNAQAREDLNLIVPQSVQPLAPEFQRLTVDLQKQIGEIGMLSQVQENSGRQDLALLSQTTRWDARLIALAAIAVRQAPTTGMGPDILYALFRMGLPTDPQYLATVPPETVQQALTKARLAGILGINDQQITGAMTAFQNFASKTRLASTAPGAVSSFGDLLKSNLPNPAQQAAFANLYFSQPVAGADLWKKAANLGIPAATLDSLKLQGKFLHLTFNNAPLTQKIQQEIGSMSNLSQLADKDYYTGATWKTALTALAGTGDGQALQKLIPAAYGGKNVGDRLETYAAHLARKVRLSFPTQVAARMIDKKELAVDQASAGRVSAFLRAAAPLGYELGRTPLNAFLKASSRSLPAMDAASTQSLKTLHRLYQLTPSSESLQAALKLGFTSAQDIVSYAKDEFMNKFAAAFPSPGEASLVYDQARLISSVTFNFFSMAKHLDSAPPVYGLSGSADDRQNAKNAIVQQFPTMASLFGSVDFCQCEECRSVLSPAAYFVDLLQFLDSSPANPIKPITYTDSTTGTTKKLTPLDVLIGNKDANIGGRRPDLAALPLTCENTNTTMPYIDLVNEILEYYAANQSLDANAAYDTGEATTADLTAEPQHILPQVYNSYLKNARYPLSLPFDLWIETVRGFLNYFKIPLAHVLEVLRPVDDLELFTDANSYPYYRAQILAESLGLSPAEYWVLTVIDPATQKPTVQNWYGLYGYSDETTALSGQPDPTDPSQYLVPPLKSAKNLAQRLGVTYQELTDLVTTGFLNPALNLLTFQFKRFGIDMNRAFSYTGQPGYTPPLSGQAKTDFEALLDGITQQYKKQNPSSAFDARMWLKSTLPANYSPKVLVLRDVDTGCDFTATTFQYADGSAAKPLDFLKLNLFVRLWKKLGWTLDEIDRALQLFFPWPLPGWNDPNLATAFSSAWKSALVNLAHLDDLATQLNPAAGRVGLLPLWSNIPTQGINPLYAHLFLVPSILNNDPALDDPAGQFPSSTTDPLMAHLDAVQGVFGLTSDEVAAILTDAASATTVVPAVVSGQNVTVPGFSLVNLSICYRYSLLAKCLQLSVSDLIGLKALSGLNPFQSVSSKPLAVLADDALFNQTLKFIRQVAEVQASEFTVGDLKYLLRHQFDPVGKYRADPNALMGLVQSVASSLNQIQAQNAVPPDLAAVSEDLIEQRLSGLFPAQVLKALFALLMNSQIYQAVQGNVASGSQIDPTPFAQETQLALSYDGTTQTQTVSYRGVLLDWKNSKLLQINNSPLFAALLNGVQQQAQLSFTRNIGDILGVWASLAEYEAVQTRVATGLVADPLAQKDPAVSLSYDQADQLQWLAYRGVLTDTKKAALTAVNPSPILANLLNDVQQQSMPAYRELLGALLAMWANVQSFEALQANVVASSRIDPAVFSGYPEIQASYDSTTQVQKLTYQGVLTDAKRIQLSGLISTSTVLAGLLQTVRNQAVQFFQTAAAPFLTVTAADLDNFSQPFLGIVNSEKQKRAKQELVKVFLPLMAQKLSRQLIVQTLAANLGSDPSLTGALVTDAGLLAAPTSGGKSLLQSFIAIGQEGVSASYYSSADRTGPVLAEGIAATTDTADSTNPNAKKPGTGSAHFEGYLQVPTDGPYRFFAELSNKDAQVAFELDSPDPTALFKNPIFNPQQAKATKDSDEFSQFIQLKGGVPYHFLLDFTSLGSKGGSLLLQGENMPKGPLSQVVLYPQKAVEGFTRARALLSKVLQLLQGMGLDEREVSYLTANASHFNNLRLSALPTLASEDSLSQAVTLFSQFLTLADYAALRKGPAGGSDGLVDVFEHVGETFTEPAASADSNQDPNTPWNRLAHLMRRDPQVVRDVAKYFHLITEQTSGPTRQVVAVGDFGSNKGIRRIWETLQLVKLAGIPVSSLTALTAIVAAPPGGSPTPDVVAASMKNAARAQFGEDSWRSVAQSVFDKLRQKKRDALVAYLLYSLQLQSSEQLFEYFLVDPGMEPVVQTSRLRLVLSSAQTFIQRCLLNLENGNIGHPERNVAPGAIDAEWWGWMKRYRVWQANREIFLFPENWMEPELRLDKTDLFQAMESALLQGDVTRDLVEDAFLTYLKGLDVRARLDLVALYLDQSVLHPGFSTLHVVGRTYGHPHKYFYRTYSSGSWSAWETVTPDIEGDHVVCVVWRGRLNLFWVTFLDRAAPNQKSTDTTTTFQGMANEAVPSFAPQKQVKVQLHWSEYFQGKWSNRTSTDLNRYSPIDVRAKFDPAIDVHIHVSKSMDSSGNEGPLKIHLDFPHDYDQPHWAFRVTSKNCDPDFGSQYWEAPLRHPYTGVDPISYTGRATLEATFANQIAGWASETPLGGSGKQIAVGRNADGRLEVFCIGTDDQPYHNWQTAPGGSWSGWTGMTGIVKQIAVAQNADGRLELFGIGSDNQAYHNWQTAPGGGWSGWAGMTGWVKRIAVGRNADGRLELFGIGSDDQPYHNWQTAPGSSWSGWVGMTGGATQIAVGQNADGRLELFCVGIDGQTPYHNWQTTPGGGWSGWWLLGGWAKQITVGQNADGRLEVFYVGPDTQLYHNWQTAPNSGWAGEYPLGGDAKQITVMQNQDGSLEVFSVGTDDRLYHNWQTSPNNGWAGETPLGGSAKQVAVGRNADGRLEVFYIGMDDQIYHNWQTVPNIENLNTMSTEIILQAVNNFTLVTCASPVVPPFLDPSEPLYEDAGALVSPFFYKDTGDPHTQSELTFFVQPSLTETTIKEWEGWAIQSVATDPGLVEWVNQINLVAQVPAIGLGPMNPDPVYSLYTIKPPVDWATTPATAISFGNVWIGQGGGITTGGLSAAIGAGTVAIAGVSVPAAPPFAGALVAFDGLTLVGSQGPRLDQLRSIQGGIQGGLIKGTQTGRLAAGARNIITP